MNSGHFVYILKTVKDTFYCGYATDPYERFNNHVQGKGAKYTKAFKPDKLVYIHQYDSKSQALKEEYRIKKKLTRLQKIDLIASEENELKFCYN